MSDNFDELEKMLKEQKIKKVPPHLMSRFSEEVLERIDPKPRARFSFRLFPVLVPAAIGIVLTSIFLLPDLKNRDLALVPESRPALVSAPAPALGATQLAKAPLSLEQQLRLLEDLGDTTEFDIATSNDEPQQMPLETQIRILEDFDMNHLDEDVLTDDELMLYELDTTSRARG